MKIMLIKSKKVKIYKSHQRNKIKIMIRLLITVRSMIITI